MCMAIKNFADKYGDDKRGEKEWEAIFVAMVDTCIELKKELDKEDKGGKGGKGGKAKRGIEEDAYKLGEGLVKMCGGVKKYVDAHGEDTGDDKGNELLGSLIDICMAVKDELDSMETARRDLQAFAAMEARLDTFNQRWR